MEGGHVEGLGEDSLAGEGCVAVDDEGEYGCLAALADALLLGACAAEDDGVDGFEVAGIGGEVEVDDLAIGEV